MKTTVVLDHRPAPGGGRLVRMLLRIEGSPPSSGTRTPLNLALVLDRSGSMAGGPLDAAKEAAVQLVRRLWPEDRVNVVVYDDEVATVADAGDGAHADRLTALIRGIDVGGMTNLSGGWLRGRELVARDVASSRINRVLLLTDGQANVGITDHDTLASMCGRARQAGITTTTIGFGVGYDEHLLRAMATAGGGALYYIEQIDQAAAVFSEELDDLLDTTAQGVTVGIDIAGGSELAAVRHAYPSTGTPTGVRLDVGDLYAREPRLVLAEFLMPDGATSAHVATVTVTASVIDGGDVRSETVTLPIELDVEGQPHTNAEIERESLLLDAADARERALEQRSRGDYDAARETLGRTLGKLRAAAIDDERIAAEVSDLALMVEEQPDTIASELSAKYMYQRVYDARRARTRKSDIIARRKGRPHDA